MEEILEILEKNNKLTEQEIAVMLNKSVEEVKETIKKLEEENVILGYNTLINWEKTKKESVTALIEVKVTPQRGEGFDTVAEHFNAHDDHIRALGFKPDVMSWNVSRCSSGEKQRLSVLRLLSNCPRVLLLDEPTANLDENNAARVEDLVAKYLASYKAIAIWVSHDASQLRRVAQKRYCLSDGQLQQVNGS